MEQDFLAIMQQSFLLKKILKLLVFLEIDQKNRKLDKVKYLYADISQKKLFSKLKTYSNIGIVINFGGEVDHSKSIKIYNTSLYKNLIEFFDNKKYKCLFRLVAAWNMAKSFSPQKRDFHW